MAKRCPALEVVHIEGAPTLEVLADVGWGFGQPKPLRFARLKVAPDSPCMHECTEHAQSMHIFVHDEHDIDSDRDNGGGGGGDCGCSCHIDK